MTFRISWTWLACALSLGAVGIVVGLLIPPDGVRVAVSQWLSSISGQHHLDGHNDDDHHDEPEYEHVDVSRSARETLGLKVAPIELGTYTAKFMVPAVVVERPAVSDLHVVTEFEGIIKEILAVPGEAVREGDPLFRIRLTGDTLAASQSALLDAVQQVAILQQEMARLRPVAEEGGLAGRRLLELEYEHKRLLARKENKRQELMIRGLSEEQIAQITETRRLVQSATVTLPEGLTLPVRSQARSSEETPRGADDWAFTIESLDVTPGTLVRPGDPLCNLAYHASLFLMGHAFERDVAPIAEAIAARREVMAELGEDRHPMQLEGLHVVHLDNHVDPETQTYRFYVELENAVLQDNIRADGRRFRTWRFKPGQRGHIGLPRQVYTGVFVLPAAAVTRDGLDQIVFRLQPETRHDHDHDHDHAHDHHHDHDEDVDEFVPVPVSVLYRDRRTVVVSANGRLRPGDVIAMNSAYQLLLAMMSGDGDHDHHHHDH